MIPFPQIIRVSLLLLLLGSLSLSLRAAPEATRVLIIANRNSPVSVRLAQYYRTGRAIPPNNLFLLDLPDSSLKPAQESISYLTYQTRVEKPLRAYLKRSGLEKRIRYLVLIKGVPLRVLDVLQQLKSGKPFAQIQSLDSTLAALDYSIAPIELQAGKQILGLVTPNIYWRQSIPFDHALTGGYLVTRLDGYTEADARALVQRALKPRPRLTGVIILDPARHDAGSRRPQPINIFDPRLCTPLVLPRCTVALQQVDNGDYNDDLRRALQVIQQSFPQLQGILAPPKNFLTGRDLMGYVSWGSNDEVFNLDDYRSLQFRPGAIADTAVSTSARTFFPTQGGQSLVADLIQAGVTGIRGYSDEPYLVAISSPSVLLENYLAGANLAESFYRASRFVGWRDIVLGDPLATAVYAGDGMGGARPKE